MARGLMETFAERTGLTTSLGEPKRYLWTDAFALCNFLELFRRTGEERYLDLAQKLVHQVNECLGRHRPDHRSQGWISGLNEEEGRKHPTIGGLRIGKKLNERPVGAPFDEKLEWDRDGQYYHYLTKWMHALNCFSRVTGREIYQRWAIELAKTANKRFIHESPLDGKKRLYWKMSIDLTRPLVPAMSRHDPLDGLVTCLQLQATAGGQISSPGDLHAEIAELEELCAEDEWVTDDQLGIGGLLFDACRMAQIKSFEKDGADLLKIVIETALVSMESLVARNPLLRPAAYRLPFRELGLAIGLRGIHTMCETGKAQPGCFDTTVDRQIDMLQNYVPLAEDIEKFWLDSGNRESESWQDHLEINTVMLATSLLPQGFLRI